jgi:alkylhydroperoxidase family enzyme
LRGGEQKVVEALRRGKLNESGLAEKEVALLEYVELLTMNSYKATPEHVQRLEQLGWTTAAITECVYVTALFALFNRIADAFGLQDPQYDASPEKRPPSLAEKIDTDGG